MYYYVEISGRIIFSSDNEHEAKDEWKLHWNKWFDYWFPKCMEGERADKSTEPRMFESPEVLHMKLRPLWRKDPL